MQSEIIIILALVTVAVLVLGLGYRYADRYADRHQDEVHLSDHYFIEYLDWSAINHIFEDPMVYKYFTRWGPVEREHKTRAPHHVGCPQKAVDWFKLHVRNFTRAEKHLLDHAVRYLRRHECPHRDWKFVKIHSSLEFGYPFTLGQYIFMPHRHLERGVQAMRRRGCMNYSQFNKTVENTVKRPWLYGAGPRGRDYETLRRFVYLVAHERVHVHQRYNPSAYRKLYSSIGFVSVPKSKVVLDSWTRTHRVTNPDSDYDNVWLTEINDQWFMPMMVLDHGHVPRAVLVHVKKHSTNGVWSPLVYLGKVVYYAINDMPEYAHRFYLSSGMYDPNEIIAYLAADLKMGYDIEPTEYNLAVTDFVLKHKIL